MSLSGCRVTRSLAENKFCNAAFSPSTRFNGWLFSNSQFCLVVELFASAEANKCLNEQTNNQKLLFFFSLLPTRPKQSLQNCCINAISHEKDCCCTECHHRCDAVVSTKPLLLKIQWGSSLILISFSVVKNDIIPGWWLILANLQENYVKTWPLPAGMSGCNCCIKTGLSCLCSAWGSTTAMLCPFKVWLVHHKNIPEDAITTEL